MPPAASEAAAPRHRFRLRSVGTGDRTRARLRSLLELSPFLALLVAVLVVPVAGLLAYSFRPSTFLGVESGFTFENYSRIFSSHTDLTILVKTLAIGLSVAGLVTALAFVVGYALTFRFRRRTALVILGIILAASISSLLVRVYAWATILGNDGLVNSALQRLGLIDEPLTFLLFGYFAIIVTMVYVYLPIGTLILYGAFQNVDPRSLEASRDLGAGRIRTITRVVAPQVSVGLVSTLAFVTILASADYITPTLVGGARGQTIGTVIRDTALIQGDYASAAALGLTFGAAMVASFLALGAAWRLARPLRGGLSRQLDRLATTVSRGQRRRRWHGSLSKVATLCLVGYLILPTLLVIVFSFNDSRTVGLPWQSFTTEWYSYIVHRAGFTDALATSGRIAGSAVVVSLAIGVPVALALTRLRGVPARLVWLAVVTPFLIPGVLWGVSLITLATEQGFTLGPGITSLVHILLAVPLVVLVVYVRLTGMDRNIVEAARDLGAAPMRVWRTVTIPLMLPSLVGAALFAAAYSLDELFVTNFTIGSGNTVPVWILGQIRYGFNPGINALGVMLLVATLIVFALAVVLLRQTLFARSKAAG